MVQLTIYVIGVIITFILIRRQHRKDFSDQTWFGVIFILLIALGSSWLGIIFWFFLGGCKPVNRFLNKIGKFLEKKPPTWL